MGCVCLFSVLCRSLNDRNLVRVLRVCERLELNVKVFRELTMVITSQLPQPMALLPIQRFKLTENEQTEVY